jgi:hypothetical protein
MSPKDLIPTFLWELEHQKPCRHRQLVRDISKRFDVDGYFESEESDFDLEELFDALNEYCPEYFYFGSHPGDGADYGWWLSEGALEEDFDGLRVSDLSEVPSDYYGEILLINDHGNTSLYRRARNNRLSEIWSYDLPYRIPRP